MIRRLLDKIESKRDSKNLVWKTIIKTKDTLWHIIQKTKKVRLKIRFALLPNSIFLKKRFKEIYSKNLWGNGSGSGSTPETTEEYRKFLMNFLKKHKIRSVLDAGCGDWQFSKLINWKKINYLGTDVVAKVIIENNKKYSGKNIKFCKLDIVNDPLPEADLIILKDVLQHLSNKNIMKVLAKIKKFKYVLIINDFSEENRDCLDGDYRPINLKLAPFNLNCKEIFKFSSFNKRVFLIENILKNKSGYGKKNFR